MTKQAHIPSREPNRMVRNIAAANLTIDEIRILAKIVEAFRSDQKLKRLVEVRETPLGDKILKFKYTDLVPNNYRNYSGLRDALSSLRKRSADILTPEKDIIDGWITKAIHDKVKGEVEIVVGKEIVPEYIALGDGYTEYLANTVFDLNSKYTIHLYKLLAKNKDKQYFNLYLSFLRSFLGIADDQYKVLKDFKRRVLEPAYKELKHNALAEKADIYFEIDWSTKVGVNEEKAGVLKDGRVITGYRIEIINRKAKGGVSKSQDKKIKAFVLSYMDKVGLNKRDTIAMASLRNWCIKYGTDRVVEKLNRVSGYVKKSKKKLDYIQKVLVAEFERKEEQGSGKARDMAEMRRRMGEIGRGG